MEVGDGFDQNRLFTCMKCSNNKLKEILISTLCWKIVFSSVYNLNIHTYKNITTSRTEFKNVPQEPVHRISS